MKKQTKFNKQKKQKDAIFGEKKGQIGKRGWCVLINSSWEMRDNIMVLWGWKK